MSNSLHATLKVPGVPMPPLQTLLGIGLPIIRTPMAEVLDNAPAVAVANARGLGSLPCAMLSLETMRDAGGGMDAVLWRQRETRASKWEAMEGVYMAP